MDTRVEVSELVDMFQYGAEEMCEDEEMEVEDVSQPGRDNFTITLSNGQKFVVLVREIV